MSVELRPYQQATVDAIRAHWAYEERELKRMLSLWVSELEPVVVRPWMSPTGMIGLTFAGIPVGVVAPIVIKANPQ